MNVNAALERGNLIGDLFVCFVSAIWHVKVPMTHCFAAPLVLLNAAHLATLTDIRDGDEDAFSTEAFAAPVAAVAERPAVPAGTFIKSLQAISTSIESAALKSLFEPIATWSTRMGISPAGPRRSRMVYAGVCPRTQYDYPTRGFKGSVNCATSIFN